MKETKLQELERRIEALEQRPIYYPVFQPVQPYPNYPISPITNPYPNWQPTCQITIS
jgi:hypothetical protein